MDEICRLSKLSIDDSNEKIIQESQILNKESCALTANVQRPEKYDNDAFNNSHIDENDNDIVIFEGFSVDESGAFDVDQKKVFYKKSSLSKYVSGAVDILSAKKIRKCFSTIDDVELFLLSKPTTLSDRDPIFTCLYSRLPSIAFVAYFPLKSTLDQIPLCPLEKEIEILPAGHVLPVASLSKSRYFISQKHDHSKETTAKSSKAEGTAARSKYVIVRHEKVQEDQLPVTPVKQKLQQPVISSVSRRGVSLDGCTSFDSKESLNFEEVKYLAVTVTNFPENTHINVKEKLLDPFKAAGATISWLQSQGTPNEIALVVFGARSHALQACRSRKINSQLKVCLLLNESAAIQDLAEKMNLKVPGRPVTDSRVASRLIKNTLGIRSQEAHQSS